MELSSLEFIKRNANNMEAVGQEVVAWLEEVKDYVENLEEAIDNMENDVTKTKRTVNLGLLPNFNSLLEKLDSDATVTDTDYSSTLEVDPDNL